jgi:hypothetical protein
MDLMLTIATTVLAGLGLLVLVVLALLFTLYYLENKK